MQPAGLDAKPCTQPLWQGATLVARHHQPISPISSSGGAASTFFHGPFPKQRGNIGDLTEIERAISTSCNLHSEILHSCSMTCQRNFTTCGRLTSRLSTLRSRELSSSEIGSGSVPARKVHIPRHSLGVPNYSLDLLSMLL